MVSIAHLSDCHLGYRAGKKVNENSINLREQDGYDALEECISQIIEEEIDLVVISGDLFHSAKPTMTCVSIARDQLYRLAEKEIKTYIITGNHDTNDVRGDYSASAVLHNPLIGIYSYEEPLVVEEPVKGLKLWLLSHHNYKKQQETIKSIELDEKDINILVTHGSCYDEVVKGVLTSRLEPREIVISEELTSMPWDYSFLGHIHERGWVHSRDRVTDTSGRKQYYAGSLIRRGFADEEVYLGRGWTKWTVDLEKRTITPKMFSIHQRSQYDVRLDCSNKDVSDIERVIDFELKRYNLKEEQPIFRLTLLDIDSDDIRRVVNWEKIKKRLYPCLTWQIRFEKTDNKGNEFEKIDFSKSHIFSESLEKSFQTFWKEIKVEIPKEDHKKVKEISEEFLKRGINQNLSGD